MIKDYKSHTDDFAPTTGVHHARVALLVLTALALTATAVFASFQLFTEENPAQPVQNKPTMTEEQLPPKHLSVPLTLPGQATGQQDKASPDSATPASMTKAMAQAKAPTQTDVLPSKNEQQALDPVIDIGSQNKEEDIASIEESAPAATDETIREEKNHRWVEEKVNRGDSLARIFSRLKLSPTLLHNIITSSKTAKRLANIKPGQTIKIRLDSDGELRELIHQRNKVNSLQIVADGDTFKAEEINRDLEARNNQITATITHSLFESAQQAGLPDNMIMDLAYIFGWDIDFALDIRAGDHFSVIYEELYLDGKKYKNGAILAAEFINQGKAYRAIRYVDNEGYASYFSPDGKSMRKAFLRAPVDFRRISSRFTRERFHPVLGKKRPHRGVDYAAAIGTPIKAAGDGKVIFVGRKGGYGKAIIIKHANKYTTLYAHMNGFKRGIRNGKRVKQGQVIGYVGKTGLATGPHLHYEFRVNGVHRNPLTVKLPAALPIEKRYRADFMAKSKPLVAKLDTLANTMVATVENP